jgi:hypothetical protein
MKFSRRLVGDIADVTGVGCLVGAGWAFNTILGLALAGIGLIVISAVVVDK